MRILENVIEILDNYLCDYCLGRCTTAQLLSGYSNKERGKFLRKTIAVIIDAKMIDYSKIKPSNFYGLKFKHNKEFSRSIKKPKKCWLCDNLFDGLDDFVKKAVKKSKGLDFETLLVGSKIPEKILEREEKIWKRIGIEWCESIKSEINRETGKRIGKILKKRANFKRPDVTFLIDLRNNKVKLQINSLFIFGYYKKLKRGIPQCKWGTPGKYKTSIQQIVAKPIIKSTKGKGNKFSGSGREDIDARCLDWRAFVIEILEPIKRKIELKKIEKKINKNKKVKIKGLKFSDKRTVVKIKTETRIKTYRVLVKLDKPIKKRELRILKNLIGVINQRTPIRVSHRRADLVRKRRVKNIKYKFINKKTIELRVKASAGLYIKELVSGDKGRTKPSVSELLNREAIPKDLDVLKIERPKNL